MTRTFFTPISIIILAAFSIWFSFFISKPEIASASGIFGVRSVTIGKSFSLMVETVPPSERASPLVATMTGSQTIILGLYSLSLSATAEIILAVGSIPSFTASTWISSNTASICFCISSTGTLKTDSTRVVFSATTDVITLMPKVSLALKALRSACIPAPPEQSEPATDKHFNILYSFLMEKGKQKKLLTMQEVNLHKTCFLHWS